MNQKLKFLCFWGIHNSLPSFWAKLGYSPIKIDYIADFLLKLQIRIGVHLITVELLQLPTPDLDIAFIYQVYSGKFSIKFTPGPIIFPWSFLPVLAWKTMGKP